MTEGKTTSQTLSIIPKVSADYVEPIPLKEEVPAKAVVKPKPKPQQVQEAEPQVVNNIHLKGRADTDIAVQLANYIYRQTQSLEPVYTWYAESGLDPMKQSRVPSGRSVNGKEMSFGLCQIWIYASPVNAQFVFGKTAKEVTAEDVRNEQFTEAFLDPFKQADECIAKWNYAKNKGAIATTWYAYSSRYANKHLFVIE